MTIRFDELLYPALYNVWGNCSKITPKNKPYSLDLEVIDKSQGIEVSNDVGVKTLHPAATVRVSVLKAANLTRAELRDATLVMNGKSWRIEATEPLPTPNGESDGQIMMYLSEKK